MKKITLLTLFSLFAFTLGTSQEVKQKTVFGKQVTNVSPEGLIRCASTEYEQYLQENNPKRMTDAQFEAWLAPLIQHYKSMQLVSSESGGIITIPVVVHVIHNGQPVGTAPNIPDGQVQSQITVMNQDFRRMVGTPGFNNNAVGADTQIQFALAQVDPNGNPTNGINRVNLCQASWTTAAIDSTVKTQTIWDPTLYMNMWSVQFSDASLLGYAQFPNASGLQGLNTSGGAANTDGVVANYSYFGSRTIFPTGLYGDTTFDKGRTMTHEVGHFLGLRHIWGDGACATDYCADTPTAHTSNFGCPTVLDCNNAGNEMVQNYMDYTDDSCMNIFTQNQKDRMVVIMNNAARRASLKTSTKDIAIPLFANDASIKVEGSCSGASGSCASGSVTAKITITNRGTSSLTSATISYSIGSASGTYNWTGNLGLHASNTFDMPVNATASGTLNVTITGANGGTDQRVSNNSASGSFTMPTLPTNYTFNNYTFRLQRDRYGSETTWNLKNQAGTTLYSGGPYTDSTTLPALLTFNWTLASNNCYTFTINDSYGDGICCQYGAGYYDLKSQDGTTTVFASPTTSSFTSTESRLFSVNFLSNDEFSTLNDVFVYPNPTKNLLNISIPDGLELPKSFTINNYLGQTLVKKSISTSEDLTIDTSSFSNGVYLITLTNGSESKTLRFVKE